MELLNDVDYRANLCNQNRKLPWGLSAGNNAWCYQSLPGLNHHVVALFRTGDEDHHFMFPYMIDWPDWQELRQFTWHSDKSGVFRYITASDDDDNNDNDESNEKSIQPKKTHKQYLQHVILKVESNVSIQCVTENSFLRRHLHIRDSSSSSSAPVASTRLKAGDITRIMKETRKRNRVASGYELPLDGFLDRRQIKKPAMFHAPNITSSNKQSNTNPSSFPCLSKMGSTGALHDHLRRSVTEIEGQIVGTAT